MIATADLLKAMNTVWDASSLDAAFQALWDSGITASEFEVLHDVEAGPSQPFPYCVFEQLEGTTTDRMTGRGLLLNEIRDVPINFTIHAREISGDDRTAKKIAADLAEAVIKVFGGHPTEVPTPLVLDNGGFLLAEYQNDMGIRTGDDEYSWLVSYLMRTDVPVAV